LHKFLFGYKTKKKMSLKRQSTMIKINDILQCPACGGEIDEKLMCLSCLAVYEKRHGIPVMVNPLVTKCRSFWDSVDFATGRVDSRLDIYRRFLNPQTREAQSIWKKATLERIRGMEGLVADVATGLWGLAQEMMEINPGIIPVSSDIDPLVLEWKRGRIKEASGREFHSVASDALHFSFAGDTFGGIANADGLINMSDAAAFLAEMRRTLKPGGRLAVMHRLFDPGSRSFNLARVYGIDRTLEAGPLSELLQEAGFTDAKIVETSRALWAENPGQSFPLAGDMQYFVIVEAIK